MRVKIFLFCLLLCLAYANVHAQQAITISGSVMNQNGEPLQGATVVQTSTTNTTVTDQQGMFKLLVSSQRGTLEISYIGYITTVIPLKNQSTIHIVLKEATSDLGEVVVIGYGTQRKVNLTGAVTSVSSKTLSRSAIPNTANLLQGRLAGLEVIRPSGQPGNVSPMIRIRGMGSFGASSAPLVLIDGIIGSISSIAPNDVEDVTVLKDAASASIYGARAANGVILITTKKAKAGEPSLEYKIDVGFQSATRIPDLIWNSAEYMEMYNSARLRSGLTAFYTQDQINDYKNATDKLAYPNYNWPENILKTATIYNHSLSISKATETSKFRLGFTYSNQDGILPVYKSKRYTAFLNYESQILKRVKVGTAVNFYSEAVTDPQGGVARGIYARSPLAAPFLPDGRKSSGRAYATEPFSPYSPIAFSNGDINTNMYAARAQAFVIVDILKGLQWETKGAINYSPYYRKLHTYSTPGEFYYYQKLPGETDYRVDLSVGVPSPLGVTDYNNVSITPTLYSTLKYNTRFGGHELSTMLGYEQQSNDFRELSGSRTQFPTADLAELNAGSPDNQTLSGTSNDWALQSLFGRVAYNYQGKYLVEGNLRYDGTSRVHPDHRWGAFPSLSAGWRISEENFMQENLKWINNLKIRGSYGLLGNQEIGLYPYQDILSYANYTYGSTVTPGVSLSRMTDKNLQWEKTKVLDFGIDLDMFNGLIGLGFDWFKKDAYNILATLPVPLSLGITGPVTNNGALRNTGIELELRHSNNIGKLHYDANFQISSFKNKLVSIVTPTIGINEVGLPYNSIYMYEWDGIFQSEAEVEKSPKQNNNPKPGDLKIRDQNGDNIVDANDRVSYSRYPKFNYSLNVNLNWKRFSFSIFLQSVVGAHLFVSDWTAYPFREGIPPKAEFRNAWTPQNHSNTIPAVHEFSYSGVYGYTSDYLFRNSSYIRLKNTFLSYTLPEKIILKNIVKGLSIYISGNDLLTFTKFKDGDPEVSENSASALQYPQVRGVNIGLNVKF